MPSNHLIFCRPLLLLPSNLSQHQGVFHCIGFLHQMAKVLELQLQHQSFQRYSGLISFRIDWFDLFAVQGTLKSLLQHPSSKTSILLCSALLSTPTLTYGKWREINKPLDESEKTSGKTIALTRWTFVGKLMSFLFNMLSRLVTVFLPRRKRLLI